MAFDITTAKPVNSGKFDITTARPVNQESTVKTNPTFQSEVVSPVLSGLSTFAMGIPKQVAKADQSEAGKEAYNIMYPEQQTVPGKLLRGAAEVAGFTAGIPGKAAVFTGKMINKAAGQLPKFAGKQLASKVAASAGAGATGGALSGDTAENRGSNAKLGAALGGGLAVTAPAAQKIFNWTGRIGSTISGIEKEVFEEAQKRGFNKVLQSKYYNKKLPAQIQDRIAQNMDNMEVAAGGKYEKLTQPLRKTPFDMAQFRGDVVKIINRVKQNPFDTDASKLDNAILDGVINKAKVNNLGDALDLRRNLDDVIYSNKGELKTSFGKQVRDILNKELHKNKGLAKVDKEWVTFLDTLKESRKVLSDTGERILDRFGKMTDKQKKMLVQLEKEIGGLPFMEDLTNYSLSKEFINKSFSPSIPGAVKAISKPLLRSYLKGGEKFTGKLNKLDKRTMGLISD